ncbi:MAG: hypothetical protein KDK64_03660, partial [Chlamydiia bacterium]|nr:hypothetical protein [Chlamydiia bacterium]
QQKTGSTLEKTRAEEKLRSAEVWRKEKNQEIYQELSHLLKQMQTEKGTSYLSWLATFNQILEKTDRKSYKDNYDTFSKVITLFIHPPEDTPPPLYIPHLWNLGINLMWLDFSKGRAAEKEYFYASSQVPNLVLQANNEWELGNTKRAQALLERAKGYIKMHYSNIPLLSDRRSEEKATFILSVAEVEKKIDPEKALETLTTYMKTLSESMSFEKFFGKWAVLILIVYVSRRAMFG